MIRFLILLHRYLGIALGLVVSLWCLSGFVMMYVQFPDLSREEQLQGLDELDLSECCSLPADFSNLDLERYRVEMMAGRPVLRLSDRSEQYIIDLRTGEYLLDVDERAANAIADTFSENLGLAGATQFLGVLDRDQWTVYGGLNPNSPFFHYGASDPAATEWYVSSINGEIIQMTTAKERFWNWAGSVVHWIYPTILRQHTGVWLQVVIWLSVLGLFLTVMGVYIGITQLKFRRNGRLSPYRGVMLWHHYSGLVFGLLTLTWLLSGLLSVNPWGAHQGRSYASEVQRIRGGVLTYDQAADSLRDLAAKAFPDGTARLEGSILRGEPYLLAWGRDGESTRLDSHSLHIDPLADSSFAAITAVIRPGERIRDQGWLTTGDAYYYSHHDEKDFPVYRIQYADGERVYLDRITGQLAFAADGNRKLSRWLFLGLHRGDFFRLLRQRPIWDLLMLPLLLGVTLSALTGTWLGFRRLTRSGPTRLT